MTREEQIKILMEDNCTRAEAEKYLKNGSTIYKDLENHLNEYLTAFDDDVKEDMQKMLETGKPAPGWGVVKNNENTYYIMYVL